MKIRERQLWQLFTGVALAVCAHAAGAGEAYPHKSIRVIVPIAPGGGQDFIARLVGQRLGAAVGQPVTAARRCSSSSRVQALMQ